MKSALRAWERVTRLFAERHILTIICISILLVPFILRFNLIAGEDNYYNIRIAQNLAKGIYYDKLSYSGRDIVPVYGWPVLLAALNKIFSIPYELLATSLTLLFSLGSFLLFYSLIKKMENDVKLFSSLFLIISPAFLYLSTNSFSAVVFLMLMSVYFLSKERIGISLLSFAIITFFSISGAFVSLVAMLVYCLYIKRSKLFLRYFVAMFAASLIYAPFLLKHGLPEKITFLTHDSGIGYALKRVIFDLGGHAIALFALLLSFFGFNSLWNKRYKGMFLYIGFILLAVLSYYFDSAVYYLNFLVVIAASYGFVYIIKRKWHSAVIKKFVIFIFVLGLLFSSISFLNQLEKELPNKQIVDGLRFITDRDEVVLSSYDRGIWINTISGNKNVIDSNFYYAPDVNSRFINVQELFRIRDIEEARWIFDKYKIRYVFIDSDMKNKIWSEDEEGLLFLLKYSKEFRKIYNKNGVEIWEYTS